MPESFTTVAAYQDHLQSLLDEASAGIFRLDGLATDERLGRLAVVVSEKDGSIERRFLQAEVELFRDEADTSEAYPVTAADLVEAFSRHQDDLNDRFVTARERWFRGEFIEKVEKRIRKRFAGKFDEELLDDLSVDIEDAGWMPSHHGILPEEVERPWPNLAVAVTHLEREGVDVWAIVDWFEPLEHLDVEELSTRVEEALRTSSPSE